MTKEIEKPEAEKHELSKAEVKQELDAFKAANKGLIVSRAIFYRACWRVHTLKLYKYVKGDNGERPSNDEDLLLLIGGDKINAVIFREGCRVYKQFLTEVKKLPEFQSDTDAAQAYTEKLIDKTYSAVGNNSSYLGEVSRTRMIEGSKRETEENLTQVREIAGEIADGRKTIKEFTRAVQKKLGLLSPERAKGRKKREEGRTPGTTLGGDKVMFNFRVDAAVAPTIIDMLEKISVGIGIRKKYAEMNSDEVGSFISVMVQRINKAGAGAEIPKGQSERQKFMREHMNLIVMTLHGVSFPDDVMNGVMEDVSQLTEPIAAKM